MYVQIKKIKFWFHLMTGKNTHRICIFSIKGYKLKDLRNWFYILYSRAVWYPPPCWWGPVTRPDTASTCLTSTALMSHRCMSETGLYLFLMTKGIQGSKNCTSRSTMVVWLKFLFSGMISTFYLILPYIRLNIVLSLLNPPPQFWRL